MYVLNLNQCLKVGDSGSPLSCNAVKVSLQIKKRAFLIYLILFSLPSGDGNGWRYLWSASLPHPLSYAHIYDTNTEECRALRSVLRSGQSSKPGYRGRKIQIWEHKKSQRWCPHTQCRDKLGFLVASEVKWRKVLPKSHTPSVSSPPNLHSSASGRFGKKTLQLDSTWQELLNKQQSLTSGAGSCHVM